MHANDPHAQHLIQAYRLHQLIDADPTNGPTGSQAAYASQHAVWRNQVGEQRPTAWKVGASTRASTPTAAPVFPARLAYNPAHFPAELFTRPGIEAEIALRFAVDLPMRAQAYSREELLAAISSAHVAMELVDTRLADPKTAGTLWCLADNLLNGGLVVGAAIPHWRDVDWTAQTHQIWLDGQVLPATHGGPPLGDLFHCLPWWLEHIGGIQAGDLVTTGAWSGMHPLGAAREVVVEFAGLGRVELRLEP